MSLPQKVGVPDKDRDLGIGVFSPELEEGLGHLGVPCLQREPRNGFHGAKENAHGATKSEEIPVERWVEFLEAQPGIGPALEIGLNQGRGGDFSPVEAIQVALILQSEELYEEVACSRESRPALQKDQDFAMKCLIVMDVPDEYEAPGSHLGQEFPHAGRSAP